jgi:hypothetical protein
MVWLVYPLTTIVPNYSAFRKRNDSLASTRPDRKMSNMPTKAERLQAAHFVEWFYERTGTRYSITDGRNPPDFLLQSNSHQTWLEVTDIFLNNEQAEFLNSPASEAFSFFGSLDEPALRFVNQLNRKLSKDSHRSIFEKRGKGFLLLTCEDFTFDVVNLATVQECLECPLPTFRWMIRDSLAKLTSSIACVGRVRQFTNSFTRMEKLSRRSLKKRSELLSRCLRLGTRAFSIAMDELAAPLLKQTNGDRLAPQKLSSPYGAV